MHNSRNKITKDCCIVKITRQLYCFAQTCFFPPVLCKRHSLQHHISPHRGQRGKFEPALRQLAQDVLTRNLDASSRAARIGRRVEWPILGEEDVECTGVTGPADDGAVEK